MSSLIIQVHIDDFTESSNRALIIFDLALSGNQVPPPIGEEAGWASELSGHSGGEEKKKTFPPAGNRTPVVQPVA
jgi:hypothetical protein